jgi:thymidylate kinase
VTRAVKKAYIVAVCGIDGAGKSSSLTGLRADPRFANAVFVKKRRRDNIDLLRGLEHETWPAESSQLAGPLAEAIRWSHAYDFLRFYENDVAGWLASERLILSDRWTVCSTAFARCGTGLDAEIGALLAPCAAADLLIYLDIEPAEAMRRISARPGGCTADETLTILHEYRRAYEAVLPGAGSPVVRLRNDDLRRSVDLMAQHVVEHVPERLLN